MVKHVGYLRLYMGEISYHTILGEFRGTAIDSHNPVMTVSAGALALVRELQSVTAALGNAV